MPIDKVGLFKLAKSDTPQLKTDEPVRTKLSPLKKKQRILDIGQRATTLALSVIILGIMSHAYITFLKNKDVTVDGQAIYPSFMTLWPTYLMITAGAVTVAFNACVLGFRIHGSVKDFNREELYNKGLDYVLHGINGLIWLGTSTSFGLSKNLGPASDPNVLWGYTCSSTASNLTETYPQIVKFYVQCELQVCSLKSMPLSTAYCNTVCIVLHRSEQCRGRGLCHSSKVFRQISILKGVLHLGYYGRGCLALTSRFCYEVSFFFLT